MFTLLGPQAVRHSSGFVVRVLSRDSLELIDTDGSIVTATIEFGPISTIYSTSIVKRGTDGSRLPLPRDEENVAALKLKEAMQAMGGAYEVV